MSRPRKGDRALLSVTHPITGGEISIGATTIRVDPEKYLSLVDGLCSIAFLAPHVATQIRELSRELGIAEVLQYLGWMAEADKNKSWKKESAA